MVAITLAYFTAVSTLFLVKSLTLITGTEFLAVPVIDTSFVLVVLAMDTLAVLVEESSCLVAESQLFMVVQTSGSKHLVDYVIQDN